LWLNLESNTVQTTSEGGSCDETTTKKGHHFAEGDDKKKWLSVFSGKKWVTPSVAAPGHTNPSDATERNCDFD